MSFEAGGANLTELFPFILKLLSHPDMVVKKTVYTFLTLYASSNPDVSILAVNTLVQECSNSNPMIRGLAVKTLCSLSHGSFIEFGLRCVLTSIKDSSAYVRRVAVISCSKINEIAPDLFKESGLIDQLYGMLRDSDPIVIVNAVMSLEEILESEGGMVINKNIARHLLNKLEHFSSWGQSYVVNILKRYKPKNEDELFDILNVLDTYLMSSSAEVSCVAVELFLELVKDYQHLRVEVFKRTTKNFVSLISSGNWEQSFIILELLEIYVEEIKESLIEHFKIFFCKHKEPSYLKVKKIQFLSHLVNSETVNDILNELHSHISDSCRNVSFCSLAAMGKILESDPSVLDACFEKFKELLNSDNELVLSNTLQVLQKINLKSMKNMDDLIKIIVTKFDLLTDEAGKCSLLSLLGIYGGSNSDCPYLLEEIIDNLLDEKSVVVRMQLLTCTMVMFFNFPAVCQGMLGQLLEHCMLDDNKCLNDQAKFYYDLLEGDLKIAELVVKESL